MPRRPKSTSEFKKNGFDFIKSNKAKTITNFIFNVSLNLRGETHADYVLTDTLTNANIDSGLCCWEPSEMVFFKKLFKYRFQLTNLQMQ